jgi:hypothetical protein
MSCHKDFAHFVVQQQSNIRHGGVHERRGGAVPQSAISKSNAQPVQSRFAGHQSAGPGGVSSVSQLRAVSPAQSEGVGLRRCHQGGITVSHMYNVSVTKCCS